MDILRVSKSMAYTIIRNLNFELKEKGYLTVAGRVPVSYFKEKLCCDFKRT